MAYQVLEHIHIFCRTLEPVVVFFTTGFGAIVEQRRMFGEQEGAILNIGSPVKLYVKQMPEDFSIGAQGSINHIGLLVENLEAACEAALAAPGATLAKPIARSGARRLAFIQGPEGILVELLQNIE